MIGLTLALAILLLIFRSKAPKPALYMILVFGLGVFVLLIALMFVANVVYLGVILIIIGVVYLIFLFCTNQKLKKGVKIFKITAKLLKHKPAILAIPFGMLFFMIIYEAFWFMSFFGIAIHQGDPEEEKDYVVQRGLNIFVMVVWVLFNIFFTFIFYHATVFLISTASAIYFYGLKDSFFCTGLGRIFKYHLGSFQQSYFLALPVAILRQLAECDQRGNVGGGCGLYGFIASCCLRSFEGTPEVLNHNSIITMAISGEDYLRSARTTLSLVSYNFKTFYVLDYVSTLSTLSGIILLIGFSGSL